MSEITLNSLPKTLDELKAMPQAALTVPEEFHRVLTPGGVYLQVLAAEDHLLGLKKIIYPELLRRQKDVSPDLPG